MAHAKESPFTKHSHEFREKASALGHDVQDLGKITKSIANDALGMLNENAGQYYEQGIKKAREMEKSVEGKIKENPVKAVLIAAGIGVVLGALWRRR